MFEKSGNSNIKKLKKNPFAWKLQIRISAETSRSCLREKEVEREKLENKNYAQNQIGLSFETTSRIADEEKKNKKKWKL